MSDIVERLRSNAMPGSLMDEAADRIETLEAALRDILKMDAVVSVSMQAVARAAFDPASQSGSAGHSKDAGE